MSKKYGGGGVKCKICGKTVYGGELITFEKESYHVNCFRCTTCNKKMGPHEAQLFEGKLYDRRCYQRNGFAQRQKKVVWTKSTATTTTTSSSGSSKFGGGGVKCTICVKTVYPAEKTVFEKKVYHNNCFKCSKCKKKITTSDCLSDPDKLTELYCRKCAKTAGITAKQLNSTKNWQKTGGGGSSKFGGGGAKCQLCDKTVYRGEQVNYEKKVYHPKCLKCATCGKVLKPAQTDSFEGNNYCHKCFATGGFAQKQSKVKWKKGQNAGGGSGKYGGGGVKCYNCAKTVYAGEKVTFEKHVYHVKCFKCDVCGNKMTTSSANHFSLETNEHAKKLGIEYEEKNGPKDVAICKKCFGEKQVRGLQATQKKWVSKSTSSGGTDSRFNAFGGGGSKCKVCSKTVYPAETVNFEKQIYHGKCFCCQECNKKLDVSKANYTKNDGVIDVYCEKCYYGKGLNRAKLNTTTAGHDDEEEQTQTQTEETTEETTTEENQEPVRDTLD